MATNYKLPPLGRAHDKNTGKTVHNVNDLYNPQGGFDPELMRQWHLKQLGDVGTIWNDFTGKGVSVGVYDDGVQKVHWELDGNYDSSKHVVIDGVTFDGGIPAGPHGTAVSGLIAGERNGRGGVGVAYDASITGVAIFDPSLPIFANGSNSPAFLQSMMQANQFDVVNHSWGGAGSYGTGGSRSNPDSFNGALSATFAYTADTGRDGLGTINVMAAGNDATPGQAHSGVTDRHVVAVAAYRQLDGAASYYSNSGGHLLVSAPSNDFGPLGGTGMVTADLLGTAGYNWSVDAGAPSDYTDNFGGTSAATPVVSGVVSLMLDANENLGWRDVQNILAASAKMPIAFEAGQVQIGVVAPALTGSFDRIDVPLNESRFKLSGADANWNGGRMHYSNDYGYGAVDAYNAARMAEVWGLFAAAKTSANEVHEVATAAIGLTATGPVVADLLKTEFEADMIGDIVRKSFTVDSDVALERLDLTVAFQNLLKTSENGVFLGTSFSDLFRSQFKLIAPDGSQAFAPVSGVLQDAVGGADQEFTFGFSGLRGVESKGTWTLEFSTRGVDVDFGAFLISYINELTINDLKLDLYGSEVSNDDVHTYTNEFFTMAAIAGERGRQTLVDTDDGTDWINAAAVSADVKLSLVAGQSTTFDGERAFMIGRSSAIENAVTGDGDDTLIGNRSDNFLVAMRGNDVLNGGAGNDWLIGGTGNDRFLFDNRGTSGKDLVLDFTRGDMIGTQTALRGASADGKVTVASNTLLLLDGTRTGDTAQLSQQGGAVIQSMGQKDGYFWYAFVSGTDIDSGDVIREESFQPTLTASGMVDAIAAMSAADSSSSIGTVDGGATLTGPMGEQGTFYLYDAMAGQMSGGVLLHG
ncbi:hypothetical protein ASG29_03435 [Sphingomonas sp. Leaf412]|uniref:S8 family serine peptidase n=1 Tax=Sphingomonas sp. Leaf412 TaxID=1736370 RepID=UPI0006FB7B21|nr:S8 family serine peptidase [Sphingomonas sp. Leaf412]KQT35177.1 hypothetical protein ASG29_03435 [Sphingomonas sp. Leaf412]